MRCCQSQNREHKRDGAGGYGEDHNAVVSKKHGVHQGLQYLSLERRTECAVAVIGDPRSKCVFSHIGTIREPLMCSSRQTRNLKNFRYEWNNRVPEGKMAEMPRFRGRAHPLGREEHGWLPKIGMGICETGCRHSGQRFLLFTVRSACEDVQAGRGRAGGRRINRPGLFSADCDDLAPGHHRRRGRHRGRDNWF